MNALNKILGEIQGGGFYDAWKGGGKRGGFDTGMATVFNTSMMERDRALQEYAEMERIRSLNPDYDAIGRMFGQTPQRGNRQGVPGGAMEPISMAGITDFRGIKKPGMISERPRIVNNLTSFLGRT